MSGWAGPTATHHAASAGDAGRMADTAVLPGASALVGGTAVTLRG